jgi:Polysaccharide pyruvyl transferase
MSHKTGILVLGFYDRKNIGDEAYKLVIPSIANSFDDIVFKCIDDVGDTEVPESIDTVFLGGGDIINDYFMSKVSVYLKNFTGRVYGVSVGIPYESCAYYLQIFDHVFVRSMNDYTICCKEIGEINVSYYPDLATLLPFDKKINVNIQHSDINIGLCLAQPYFANNQFSSKLITDICDTLKIIKNTYNNIKFHLIPFNQNTENTSECDELLNNNISSKLINEYEIAAKDIVLCNNLTTPTDVVNYVSNNIDIVLCMRYHSVIFSLMTNTPFIPLHCSQKIANVLKDININSDFDCNMTVDTKFKPTGFDKDKLLNAFQIQINAFLTKNDSILKPYSEWLSRVSITSLLEIRNLVFKRQKRKNLVIKRHLSSFEDVLVLCQQHLCKYLNLTPLSYKRNLKKPRPFTNKNKSSLEIARFICFIISGQTNHPCVWGLSDNLSKNEFVLYDAIKYIWEESKSFIDTNEQTNTYYAYLENCSRRVMVNIDSILSNDFSQYHRSGWSYVLNGLMNLDATSFMRQSDIYLDTYVDRTFHWGCDILSTLGVIPYTKPWFGFVHHVFEEEHSTYNCVELFKNELFIQSLSCCHGLIALSKYLASQLRDALQEKNIDVPVYTIYHPMEFVNDTSMFTMDKFSSTTTKCVVQIGAWLRNPYSLYNLKLYNGMQKIALKGKEMDQYFAPPDFTDAIAETLLRTDWINHQHQSSPCSMCREISCVCRPCIHLTPNKYCQGLYNEIIQNNNSVNVLNKLSNEEYDKLLSENIVLLDLIECSAVNTVIECIVRNTPIILNRLPALEELLGKNYPGFYRNLTHAAEIIQDNSKITTIHNYIKSLDKSRYNLEVFVNDIQDIILGTYNDDKEYPVFKSNIITTIQNTWLARFMPLRFSSSTL